MRAISTIFWKEFKQIVTSPMFFVIAALCSVIWSYSFLRSVLVFAQRSAFSAMQGGQEGMNIHYGVFIQHISYINIIFVFAIPAITMRLIAEEKKQKTFDLLLTAPINATEITLGKFFAGLGAGLALVAVAFLYPLAMAAVTSFSWMPVLTSFLGLALLTGLYVAVGLFCSSMTESVVLSVVMGVIFNLILWFIGNETSLSDSATYQAVMEHLALGQHLFTFLKGTLNISSSVFFLSGMVFFIFLSQRVVESSRWR